MRKDLRSAILITAGVGLAGVAAGQYSPLEAVRISAALAAAATALSF